MKMLHLKNKAACCGCYACVNACPKQCLFMKADEEGFFYPFVDEGKCVGCGLCARVCPITYNTPSDEQGVIPPQPAAWAAINCNEADRLSSSSGGIFSLLAGQTLDQGGVVFGAAFNENCRSVQHIAVEEKEELERLKGSKYLQSSIGKTYQQAEKFLTAGRQVLFSGTPCQIEGLRHYLRKDYEKLLCLDFICHGVPSPNVWARYVAYREAYVGSPVQHVYFRNKKLGWKNYCILMEFENHSKYIQRFSKDPFMSAFLQNTCLRPSCHSCAFKMLKRSSDITAADFWGIQNILPDMDDDKGTSLVLIHSQKGREALEQIKDKMRYQEVDTQVAISRNPSCIKSSVASPKREEFFSVLSEVSFETLIKEYMKPQKTVKGIAADILDTLGLLEIIKRIYRKR